MSSRLGTRAVGQLVADPVLDYRLRVLVTARGEGVVGPQVAMYDYGRTAARPFVVDDLHDSAWGSPPGEFFGPVLIRNDRTELPGHDGGLEVKVEPVLEFALRYKNPLGDFTHGN